jgi:NADPH2:quinone reductase
MQALVATNYCQPEELSLQEIPVPRPGQRQILVRIAAATINATDIRVITGEFREMFAIEFPYVPGNDFAGTVTEIGTGVQFRVGDEVFGQALPRQLSAIITAPHPSLGTGTLAEYAVFEADTPLLACRPPSVTPVQAAALGIAGMTAHAVMKVADAKPGETILVIGATGSVGTTVIPLLANAGAIVVATAGTDSGAQALQRLGATAVIGHNKDQYPEGVDVVFDFCLPADHIRPAAAVLRPEGRLVSIMYPPATPEQLGRDDVAFDFIDWNADYGGMAVVAEAAGRGKLAATIDQLYPLDQAVQAVTDYARRSKVGQIVVAM